MWARERWMGWTATIRESVAVKMIMIVTPCAPGRISL
jgi:hypothetical protein